MLGKHTLYQLSYTRIVSFLSQPDRFVNFTPYHSFHFTNMTAG